MSDHEAIQGLWRLVSSVSRGQPAGHCATHHLFSGDSQKEIVPDLVDDGKLRSTFRLDENAEPKRIVVTLDYNGPSGPPDPDPIVLCGFYRLRGDMLEIASGPGDAFPEVFSDEYGLVVLERDRGPVPESRKASGTPALEDDLLGRLEWDDNLNWYFTKLPYGSGAVDVHLNRDKRGSIDSVQQRARQVVQSLNKYAQSAKEYAAEQLLDLKNGNWLEEDEEPLDSKIFIERMTLASLNIESEEDVTFYFHDGDLFWGHSIQICMNGQDGFVDADIPG